MPQAARRLALEPVSRRTGGDHRDAFLGVALPAEDRWAIGETIALHGHLFDNGEFDRLDELFTPDVVYDLTEVGLTRLHGISAILHAALELGDGNPLAHRITHVTIINVKPPRWTLAAKRSSC